jgi:hypothetical protein
MRHDVIIHRLYVANTLVWANMLAMTLLLR